MNFFFNLTYCYTLAFYQVVFFPTCESQATIYVCNFFLDLAIYQLQIILGANLGPFSSKLIWRLEKIKLILNM